MYVSDSTIERPSLPNRLSYFFSPSCALLLWVQTRRIKSSHLYGVVQRRGGRVHRQVSKGLYARRLPALSHVPLHDQHVVGEDGPEGDVERFAREVLRFGSGGQLHPQVRSLRSQEER